MGITLLQDYFRRDAMSLKGETMFATATLVAHRGATLVSREELAEYEPPEPEGRWKPVKHSLIVDLMHEELKRRQIQVAKAEYAVQKDGNYLFAVLTLNWLRDQEMSAALAFKHSHDKTEAMKMYAGVRVFICDNMALSGDEIILNRKHTTRLNVAAELTKAFDTYKNGVLMLQRNIEDMKGWMMTQTAIEATLFEIFYRRILPARMLVPIADSFYSQSERTAWVLLNALHPARQESCAKRQYASARVLREVFRLGEES